MRLDRSSARVARRRRPPSPAAIAGLAGGARGRRDRGRRRVLAGLVAAPFFARRVRSWGYCEREDDLLVRRGLLVSRLSVVPYGRMQFIDVKAGPAERLVRPRDGAPPHGRGGDRRADPRARRGRGGEAPRPAGHARRGPRGRALSEPPGAADWRRLHPLSPFVRAGRAAIALVVVFVPALVSEPRLLRHVRRPRHPRRARRARVRVVARHAVARRGGRAAHRDRPHPAQLAALSARAGAGDRRDRARASPGCSASPSCGCGWAATPATTRGSPTSPPREAQALRAAAARARAGGAVEEEPAAADERILRLDPDGPARRLDRAQRLRPRHRGAARRDRRDRGRVARRRDRARRQRLRCRCSRWLTVVWRAVQQRLPPHRRREPGRAAPARRPRRADRRDDPARPRAGRADGRAAALAAVRLVPARGRRRGQAAARGRGRSRGPAAARGAARSAAAPLALELLERILPGRPPSACAGAAPRALEEPAPLPQPRAGAATTRASSTTSGRHPARTAWVPLEKVQSLRRVEGPVQRRLRLATSTSTRPAATSTQRCATATAPRPTALSPT